MAGTPRDEIQVQKQSQMPSMLTAAGILTVVVAYFAVGTVLSKGDDTAAISLTDRPPFTVVAQRTATSDQARQIALSARTEAKQNVVVRAETAGQVATVLVVEGERVTSGAPLCRLDSDSREAVRAEARAALTKADADFRATERLFNEAFASETALKGARANLDAARARLSVAQRDLENVVITAPFDGVIAEVTAEPGDVLSIGAPCAVLADLSQTEVAGGLSAAEAARVTPGDPAIVTLDGDRPRPATVSFVGAVADPLTRAFPVKLSVLGAENVPDGLNAMVEIETQRVAASEVPRSALVFHDDGRLGVRTLIAQDRSATDDAAATGPRATVTFAPVQMISETAESVFVTGVAPGALVITRGQDFVSAGTLVTYEISNDAADLAQRG